jgi:hypothetical protein
MPSRRTPTPSARFSPATTEKNSKSTGSSLISRNFTRK